MKKVRRFLLLYIGLFMLLPGLITLFFQKDVKILFEKEERVEKYLPGLLYHVTDNQMHTETLKAMAVLVRSNVMAALEKKELTYLELQKFLLSGRELNKKEKRTFYEKLVQVCKETTGETVFYKNAICKCPYFYSSNGTTRDAYTYFKDDTYPYLVPVPSHKDEESESYITYHHFSQKDFTKIMNGLCNNTFQNQIQILEKDASGYVLWLQVGERVVGGECFRNALDLSSCCFSIEQEGDSIRITCKGRGHGFGFSQYGANAMAEEKTYKELIAYYFHNITVENMYTFS